MKKITLFLMSYKGYSILQSFIAQFGTDVIDFVITAKDHSVQHDYFDEIIGLCEFHNITVFNRKDQYEITSAFAFAISWRWLVNLNGSTLIVFHDSLLPKYRGFAPLATALINGDTKVGVTALYASNEYDKGNIISQQSIEINYPIKIKEAITRISECYIKLINSITGDIIKSKPLTSTVQDEQEASYSLWLDEKDYRIDWNKDAGYLKRFIDSVGFPFKGASANLDQKKVRVIDSIETADVQIPIRHTGKVIFVNNGKPVVVCGKGLLQINELLNDENESILPLAKFRSRFE